MSECKLDVLLTLVCIFQHCSWLHDSSAPGAPICTWKGAYTSVQTYSSRQCSATVSFQGAAGVGRRCDHCDWHLARCRSRWSKRPSRAVSRRVSLFCAQITCISIKEQGLVMRKPRQRCICSTCTSHFRRGARIQAAPNGPDIHSIPQLHDPPEPEPRVSRTARLRRALVSRVRQSLSSPIGAAVLGAAAAILLHNHTPGLRGTQTSCGIYLLSRLVYTFALLATYALLYDLPWPLRCSSRHDLL
jgi:hypothetical protein